ncbi:FAD-linked sulfhydryl oxidase ERV1 [Henckelia pumila]|uniref:FAD-linked sulfhydryl oxidase ERV1 n=1 Tax=Henckelia pumila TaxID=405737 RepID=UPI003C6DD43B
MSENPVQHLLQAFNYISRCVQTQLARFILRSDQPPASAQKDNLLTSLSSYSVGAFHPETLQKQKPSGPTTREDLGRATWTFLHTLAAQYPEKPTRQQKKDVKELMAILSRMYPCKECADHFREVLIATPVQAGSHDEFSHWLCHVHNVVNRSLGKLTFPCERVDARWGKLECENRACDLQGAASIDVANDAHKRR